ncbi:stalk domain-containing protein [Paenibacillus mesophilus]|uniref:stalk domain-containing protein n=1 Tax=Paenibacillus mesophilus TaxID=2582849 RepID=UPI0013051496|nr:stalk domain-containing protein [Paenibacillus mesophilus]
MKYPPSSGSVGGVRPSDRSFIQDGATFIPLRFVAESIDGEVKWYQDDYVAAIIAGYNIK